MNQAIITTDPEYVAAGLDELRQAAPGARRAGAIAPGVLLITLPETFAALADAWRKAPPCFVRHVCPVQAVVPLSDQDVLPALRRAVRDPIVDHIATSRSFSVQTRIFESLPLKPFDINGDLAGLIRGDTGARLDVKQPQQVVSVVIGAWQGETVAWLGASASADNISSWAGGARRFRREPEQVSRSEFKLLEALEIFDVSLPPNGKALDLGAAPGGWTRILRQHGTNLVVVAVDPGALHPSVAADWGVHHVQQQAEAYLRETTERHTFDIIVNDMRLDGTYSAHLMLTAAKVLKPSGCAIMTVKLPSRGFEPILERTLTALTERYRIESRRQLFHNRHEITLLLRPLTS